MSGIVATVSNDVTTGLPMSHTTFPLPPPRLKKKHCDTPLPQAVNSPMVPEPSQSMPISHPPHFVNGYAKPVAKPRGVANKKLDNQIPATSTTKPDNVKSPKLGEEQADSDTLSDYSGSDRTDSPSPVDTPNQRCSLDSVEFDPLKRCALYDHWNTISNNQEQQFDWDSLYTLHNLNKDLMDTVEQSSLGDPFKNTGFGSECECFNDSCYQHMEHQIVSPIQIKDISTDDSNRVTRFPRHGGSMTSDYVPNTGSTSPADIPQRSGYLSKQGGQKSNRGWKKRWVVFDGTSLRYYLDSSSAVSIRVVPLVCMTKVEVDIKPTDKENFRFRLHTTIRNRIFLFSSEKSDDCITWALTLGAAITHSLKHGFSPKRAEEPSFAGFVRINTKKHYTIIKDLKFSYFYTLEDYRHGSPVHEMDVCLLSPKVLDEKKYKMQLSTNKTFFDMVFDDIGDMQHFDSALKNAIKVSHSDDKYLKKVRENKSNCHCADCGSDNAEWASVNLCVILCEKCAGIHRTLSRKQSKINSLRMDVKVWTPTLIDLLINVGNRNANAFWEHSMPVEKKIQPLSSVEERKSFLHDKYIAKKFCPVSTICSEKVAHTLVSLSRAEDVTGVMKLLFASNDITQNDMSAAFDAAKHNGSQLVAEFLFQNGGDKQQVENTYNERLEEVTLKGYLKKTGPKNGKFKKRWCVLSHGAMMYYKGRKCKGIIQRNDMLMVRVKDSGVHQFEISTKLKNNRVFTFESYNTDDVMLWVRALTRSLMAATSWVNIDMADVHLSALGHVQIKPLGDWMECFLLLSKQALHLVSCTPNVDSVELCSIDNIAREESQYKCVAVRSVDSFLLVRTQLPRDTDRLFDTLQLLTTANLQQK